jgi:hypothetical protein
VGVAARQFHALANSRGCVTHAQPCKRVSDSQSASSRIQIEEVAMPIHVRVAMTLCAWCMAWAVGGCAQPGGAFFDGAPVPPRVQGHLYIYRPSIWFTAAAKLPVKVGTVREGELADNSYVRIALAPGWYIVDVNGVIQRLEIVAGRNHFIEVDLSRSTEGLAALSSNTLATTLTERGQLHVREEAEAVQRMRGLRDVAVQP